MTEMLRVIPKVCVTYSLSESGGAWMEVGGSREGLQPTELDAGHAGEEGNMVPNPVTCGVLG